jgi:hypothetical protein
MRTQGEQVIGIMAVILGSLHMQTADDLSSLKHKTVSTFSTV